MKLFKGNKDQGQPDVKNIRDTILYAIRQQLSIYQGGEGAKLKSLSLLISCAEDDKPMYESAVYYQEDEKFKKTEVDKIVADYNLQLPADWKMKIDFADTLPPEAVAIEGIEAGIVMRTSQQAQAPAGKAMLLILQGNAESDSYELTANRMNIGRGKSAKTPDGFFRENHICFPSDSENESNKFISSRHAHIQFDASSGNYLLYADEGGVPPNNKLKVKGKEDQVAVKLQSTQVPHALQDGDMIILGDSAMLAFKIDKS